MNTISIHRDSIYNMETTEAGTESSTRDDGLLEQITILKDLGCFRL